MARRQSALRVEGLTELRRALKSLEPDAQKELKQAGKDTSVKVSADARSKAAALGGVAAKSAQAVKATSAGRNFLAAGVAIDGQKYPWALGGEFGGGRRPTTRQFEPWRGSGSSAGYFVYPTIRDNAGYIEEQYVGALDDALRRNGFI